MASAIRWDVERILKSSMWIIFLILFLFSEFTTKTNRRLIWLSKQRKLLFNMFRLSQHYLKGSRHSNMLIREGEWYFNSIHRREALFCLENSSCHSQIEGIFTMIVRDQRKYWVLSLANKKLFPIWGDLLKTKPQWASLLYFTFLNSKIYTLQSYFMFKHTGNYS